MDDARERTLKTAARYLGMRGASAPPQDMERLLSDAYEEMLKRAAPRHALCRAPVRVEGGGEAPILHFGSLPPVPSRDLCRLLEGCKEGYALLATLGMELDLRVRSLMVTNPALATAIGACGSAYIDEYIDECIDALLIKGVKPPPRFSPGYGDAPLSMQPALLRLLNAQRLGVYLTDGLLMVPEKSVTALMGIVENPGESNQDPCGTCATCEKSDCAFRGEA